MKKEELVKRSSLMHHVHDCPALLWTGAEGRETVAELRALAHRPLRVSVTRKRDKKAAAVATRGLLCIKAVKWHTESTY